MRGDDRPGHDRVERLERQVRGIERDLNLLVQSISNPPPVPTDGADVVTLTAPHNPDIIWACAKCGSRLGMYDESNDELRVRYKDFVTYIQVGVGGSVRVVCRSCGELNSLEYISQNQPPATPAASGR